MTTLDPKKMERGLDAFLKTFAVFTVEGDEGYVRMSMHGQQVACWPDGTPQAVALSKFDADCRSLSAAPSGQAPLAEPVAWHVERMDAIVRELWQANDLDLHMCDGSTKKGWSGLLRDIRESWRAIRSAIATTHTFTANGPGVDAGGNDED